MSSESDHKAKLDPKKSSDNTLLFTCLFSLILLLALAVRLYHVTQPPMGFHPMRQYRSLIMAHTHYLQNDKSLPQWQQQLLTIHKQQNITKEPPLMEYLAALTYRMAHKEIIWLPRLFSITFWLIGGVFLYLLAKRLFTAGTAVICAAYYLFTPFGIFMSRSFQPESLMVMFFAASLLTIWQYYQKPTMIRLLTAATISSLAILIKFVAVFPVLSVFIVPTACLYFKKNKLNLSHVFLFLFIALIPGAGYYCYMTFGPGNMQGVLNSIFLPHMIFSAFFWKGWLHVIGRIAGYIAVIGGLTGIFILKDRSAKRFIISLWLGYLIYGLVFSYTAATHDYYQVLLIPITALSLGPICTKFIEYIKQIKPRLRMSILAIILLMLTGSAAIGFNIRHDQFRTLNPALKNRMDVLCNFIGANPHHLKLINYDFKDEITTAQEIGNTLNHSTKTIFFARGYGKPLMYHGQLSGVNWPQKEDLFADTLRNKPILTVKERLENIRKKFQSEYFIVTDIDKFNEQKELKSFLGKNFPLLTNKDNYLVYDLRKKLSSE